MTQDIVHDEKAQRFQVEVDGHLSVLDYEERGEAWVFTHTFVPDELRGRGVAALLVARGIETALLRRKRVEAECSYVVAYLKRHPLGDATAS